METNSLKGICCRHKEPIAYLCLFEGVFKCGLCEDEHRESTVFNCDIHKYIRARCLKDIYKPENAKQIKDALKKKADDSKTIIDQALKNIYDYVETLSTNSEATATAFEKIKSSDTTKQILNKLVEENSKSILAEAQATLNIMNSSFEDSCNKASLFFSSTAKIEATQKFDINAANTTCPSHKNEELKVFCETHLVWLCEECTKAHKGCKFPTFPKELIDSNERDTNKQKLLLSTMNDAIANLSLIHI